MKYVGIFFFVLLSILSIPRSAVAADSVEVDDGSKGYTLHDFDRKATYVHVFKFPEGTPMRGSSQDTIWTSAKSVCGEKFDGVGNWRLPTFAEAQAIARHYSTGTGKDYELWIDEPSTYYRSSYDTRSVQTYVNAMSIVYCVHSPYSSARLSELRGESKKPAEKPTSAKSSEKLPVPILTRSGPLQKTPEEIREQKNKDAKHAQEVAEQKRLQAQEIAAGKAAEKSRDAIGRQICSEPQNRGSCSCLRYFPNTTGNACGK